MGLMDSFTSDSPVTVKQPDYYAMTKEAAKAELITNAVNWQHQFLWTDCKSL